MYRQTLERLLEAHIPLRDTEMDLFLCECGVMCGDEGSWAAHVTDVIYPRG